MELTLEKKHEIETEAKRMMDRLKAIFLLAAIDINSSHQLPNGYCGDLCCPHRPWMLAETKYGLIKIGWRKRVINIDWSNAGALFKDIKGESVSKDDVTRWAGGIHAWGWHKAVEYLADFAHLAERIIAEKEGDDRMTPEDLAEWRKLRDEWTAYCAQKTAKAPFPEDKYNRYGVLCDRRRKKTA